MTPEDVRALALRLPDAVERDHHGFPSFRTGARGRVFATLPTAEVLIADADPDAVAELLADGHLRANR